jgi:hypothetical protein
MPINSDMDSDRMIDLLDGAFQPRSEMLTISGASALPARSINLQALRGLGLNVRNRGAARDFEDQIFSVLMDAILRVNINKLMYVGREN